MPSARLLDLTRLVSRVGKGPMTGIDRVEYAYLAQFLQLETPLFGLIRSRTGWLLLDRHGCAALSDLCSGKMPLGRSDLLSWMSYRGNPLRARAETAMRRLALKRAARPFLRRLLAAVPSGSSYVNVGHANLTARGLGALQDASLTTTILIHDTIPLDWPQFARAGTVESFRTKLAAVANHADRVIHITDAARQTTEAQLARLGRVPPGITAPIGVCVPHPDPLALPLGLDLSTPFFVALGTIEPRKNHALLLDVWERLGPDAPRLFIIGGRGWADQTLLDRLDALPKGGKVQVLSGLSDGAVAALLARAVALLAPSFAEGFGLPPLEAASLGTPVIAADLAVTRELMGHKAVYLSPTDRYSWVETIERQMQNAQSPPPITDPWFAPTWAEHFKRVLSHV